ncbi:MAG: LuxR C-terminal-related transcriptional regulator [Candidatus Promineifilaceae bacterium]|nr:LuxR C-terminal-related transcriptional regulator [Candidatus Promineifilaceae bacterium]
MPRWSKAQKEAQRKVRRLLESRLPLPDLSRQLLDALLIAMPADHALLFAVDPRSLLFNRLLAYTGVDIAIYCRWLNSIYLTAEPGPEVTFPGLMRAGLRAVAIRDSRELCWGFPRAYFSNFERGSFGRAVREIQTPSGGILRAWFTFCGSVVAALEIGQMDGDNSVKPTHGAFLRALTPVLGEILGAALARDRTAPPSSDPHPAATGVLVVDERGEPVLQTRAAKRWLALIEDAPPLLAHGDGLPTAIAAVRAALRGGLSPRVGEAAIRVPTSAGAVLLEAATDASAGCTAITLVADRPRFPPDIPWWWPLTPAERKVTKLVVRALTNAEIAAALVVSESTVESHLRSVYKKLRITSRTALLTRLFDEVY